MWNGRPVAGCAVEVGDRVAVAADLDDLVLAELDRLAGELDERGDVAAEEHLAAPAPTPTTSGELRRAATIDVGLVAVEHAPA